MRVFHYITVLLLSSVLCSYGKEYHENDSLLSGVQQSIMDDIVAVWRQFRDPDNGFWCDTLRLDRDIMTPCGPNNNFYSSAGTGMGMVTETIMVELGEY